MIKASLRRLNKALLNKTPFGAPAEYPEKVLKRLQHPVARGKIAINQTKKTGAKNDYRKQKCP
jgi:hypothetical protein